MATINLVGKAVVVTSSITYDDLTLVQKYRPEALQLKDEKGNPFFMVFLGDCGGINKNGVTFDSKSNNGGKAQFTEIVNFKNTDPVEAVAEYVGTSILHLSKIEQGLPEIIADIKDEKDRIEGHIVVTA